MLTSTGICQQVNPDLHYFSRKEIINVLGIDKGYQSFISYKAKTGNKAQKLDVLYDKSSKIDSFHVSFKTVHSNWINYGSNLISDNEILENNKKEIRAKSFNIKPNVFLNYSYKKFIPQAINLSSLILNFDIKTDTVIYQIKVPTGLRLLFNIAISNNDENTSLAIDSLISEKYSLYNFTAINKRKLERITSINTYEYSLYSRPVVNVFIVPEEFGVNPNEFFNKWLNKFYTNSEGLNGNSKVFFGEIFDNISSKESLISKAFSYVKETVNIIPSENTTLEVKSVYINEIITYKKGDINEISVLFYNVFKNFGFNSNLAFVSKTLNKSDFTGLSNYDYLICVININGSLIYLDPTENACIPGLPPFSLQGKEIFILNESIGEKHVVSIVPASENTSNFELNILFSDDLENYYGNYMLRTGGLSAMAFQYGRFHLFSDDFNNFALRRLESLSNGLKFTQMIAEKKNDRIGLGGNCFLPPKFVFKIGNNNYLSLKFLPFPHELPLKIEEGAELYTNHTINNNYTVKLSFENPITLSEDQKYNYKADGISFNAEINQLNRKEIIINYSYFYDDIVVSEAQAPSYNKINSYMQDVFGRMLTFNSIDKEVNSTKLNVE